MSVLLLEAYLQDAGLKAIAVDWKKHGIVTNSEYGKGRFKNEKTKERLGKKAKEITPNKVLIYPGFFGTDKEGNIVSLGRGGSDFSAAIVANALNANSLEFWKDVDGFMSADPKIISEARLLPRLSYGEAEELGYFGAKILHPKTVQPLREKGIKIVIKNVFSPEKEGTVVSSEKNRYENVIKSIAVNKKIACVTLKSSTFVGQAGVLEKIFSEMATACVSVDLVATSEIVVSFTIDENDLGKAKEAVKGIKLQLEEACFESDVAMVGLVGEGIKKTPGIAGRVFSSLGKNGVNIEMISAGSSEINISFIVKEKDLKKAVKSLHYKCKRGKYLKQKA